MDQHDFLNRVLKYDRFAVEFIECVGGISQVWDDLVDGAAEATPELINALMWEVLFVLPNNPFYRANFSTLNPVMQSIASDWMDANALEKGSHHQKTIAFVLRDRLASLVVMCAGIVGGLSWAREKGPEIQTFFMNEDFEGYLEELG